MTIANKRHWGTTAFSAALIATTTFISTAYADTIKIGAPDPLTGIYAVDGSVMLNVTKLAVADINAAGGLLGKKLEVIAFDIEDMLPEKLIAAAEVLVAKEKSESNYR